MVQMRAIKVSSNAKKVFDAAKKFEAGYVAKAGWRREEAGNGTKSCIDKLF